MKIAAIAVGPISFTNYYRLNTIDSMSHPAAPNSFEKLTKFQFEKVINEDSLTHSLTLLGAFPTPDGSGRVAAIVRIEKTALDPDSANSFFSDNGLVKRVSLEESTDIVCT